MKCWSAAIVTATDRSVTSNWPQQRELPSARQKRYFEILISSGVVNAAYFTFIFAFECDTLLPFITEDSNGNF
jgi:hypothetical protein